MVCMRAVEGPSTVFDFFREVLIVSETTNGTLCNGFESGIYGLGRYVWLRHETNDHTPE